MTWGRYHKPVGRIPWTLLATVLAGCASPPPPEPEAGVSLELARLRGERIRNLRYRLQLTVPSERGQPITGRQQIALDYRFSDSGAEYLILDFEPGASRVRSWRVNGREVEVVSANGHLLVPEWELSEEGAVQIEIDFVAGDPSLNRQDEYLYTLFVPDRAREAFPCFDQPDLRAVFELELDLPPGWTAVSNGGVVEDSLANLRRRMRFAPTPPISTYLFAFAAGRFAAVDGISGGRPFRFLHREGDREKVERNRQALLDLHAGALEWMEQYTGLVYPFPKFEFVLLPAFEFGGMEHPGAVFYRAERLLLDESPTRNEVLGRASLIGHETAHMWFGDLVTMRWFDDVWTKEVFANFMAAKLTRPQFPEVDHDLRFYLSHYPAAYDVDRSAGTHPIRQELENLAEAASLYGDIIYDKAPIVMRQLESLMGEDALREGLRDYLRRFAFGNASWRDLVAILDARSDRDLDRWSRVWVESAGRPHVRLVREQDEEGRDVARLVQNDPAGRGRMWSQPLHPLAWSARGVRRMNLVMESERVELGWVIAVPSVLLPAAGGVGYGRFQLPGEDLDRLLESVSRLPRALDRAVAWETCWDALLEGELPPADFLDALLEELPGEGEELLTVRMLALLRATFWGFLPAGQREARAPAVEEVLWRELRGAQTASLRLTLFRALRSVALTPSALERVSRVWRGGWLGLELSASDQMETALELALREGADAEQLLEEQSARLEEEFLREQFAFVVPAVSPNPRRRRAFFESLSDPQARQREPWVIQALGYLHHPLRADESLPLIEPALGMLEEVQRTGDIFFPRRWLDAVLEGHQSPAAARVVQSFLDSRPEYPPRLRQKVLQSTDLLFRKSRVVGD